MSLDVTNGGDGLIVPVMVPQGAESIEILERIARGVEALGAKTDEASKSTEKSTEAAKESESAWKKLAETYTYVTGAAENVIGKLNAAITTIASLSSEQDRLSRQSARLGLDFNAAADAAGLFTDETEAMGAATRLAQAGIGLTQEQLNALTRTAGSFAEATGETTASAIDQLTQGLISGSERGLRPFGADLAAVGGESHTVEERLAALTEHAQHVAPAVDDATHAVARFKDMIEDAGRTIASGFVDKLRQIGEESAQRFGEANTAVESLDDKLRSVGETGALAFHYIYTSANLAADVIAAQVTTVGQLVSLLLRIPSDPLHAGTIIANARAAITGAWSQVGRTAQDFTVGADDPNARDFGAGGSGVNRGRYTGGREELDATSDTGEGPAQTAGRSARSGGDARTRMQRLLDRAIAGAGEQDRNRSRGVTLRGELEGVFTGVGEIRPPGEDQSSSKGGRLDGEREAGTSAESRFSDFAKDRDDQRRAERERRTFEQRYQAARTFTDRWEDLHQRQVSATAEAAGAMDNALGALGTSLAKHFESIVKGQETVGEALKGILTDTLDAIAKESFTKGGFYAAEAIAKLVMYDFPGAATAAAASAAYFAAGATATGLGAAVGGGGSAPAAPAGGGSAPRSERTSGAANDNADASGQTIVQHFYAPVIGGRTATNAEVGAGMNRYTDATARRQVRARG